MHCPLQVGAKARVLAAAKADAIPKASSGLWFILKFGSTKEFTVPRGKDWQNQSRFVTIPAGSYTQLWRLTMTNLHQQPPGELVMQDTPDELHTHLNFMLRAHGDVLITGLGLGCVARGCMANPRVKSVTVIERDPDVLALVAPYMPPAIRIVKVDALSWADVLRSQPLVRQFDCAWHDLWSDPDDEKSIHLQLMHSHLIAALSQRVRDFQGAWQLPRWFRHRLSRRRRRIVI